MHNWHNLQTAMSIKKMKQYGNGYMTTEYYIFYSFVADKNIKILIETDSFECRFGSYESSVIDLK